MSVLVGADCEQPTLLAPARDDLTHALQHSRPFEAERAEGNSQFAQALPATRWTIDAPR